MIKKISKAQLQKMIKESVQGQVGSIACEQKRVAAYARICVAKTPFLREHRNLKNKKSLLEFFGPFKKLNPEDLEKMGKEKEQKTKSKDKSKDIKVLSKMAKEVEQSRKKLGSINLTNVSEIDKTLDDYINKLYDLYELQQVVDLDQNEKEQIGKPFAAAAYTLQNLSKTLNKAANKLFQAVPKGSGLYSAGKEAADIEKATKAFMMGPGERLKQAGKDVWSGMSGPPGGRFSKRG